MTMSLRYKSKAKRGGFNNERKQITVQELQIL